MWNTLSDTHKNIVIIFSILGLGISIGFTVREWGNLAYRFDQHINYQQVRDSIFEVRLDVIEERVNLQVDSLQRMMEKLQLSICEMAAQDIVTIRQCRK